MSRLNLHCELCGRRQANGLLSSAAWAAVELSPELTVRACPTCRTSHSDWERRLRDLTPEATPGDTRSSWGAT